MLFDDDDDNDNDNNDDDNTKGLFGNVFKDDNQ